MIALRNPYALVGDPPGASFGNPAPHLPSTGLNSPVFLDEDPPAQLFRRVCQELTVQVNAKSRPRLAELLPDEADGLWEGDPADGLVTTVGRDGEIPVTLRFNDLTPHWLISGRPGAGKSAFLINVLYGLCTRYSPDDLTLYLLDFADGSSFEEVVPAGSDPSWLPHARVVGMESDREYGLAVLRELDAEVTRRAALAEAAGVTRFAESAGPAPDAPDPLRPGQLPASPRARRRHRRRPHRQRRQQQRRGHRSGRHRGAEPTGVTGPAQSRVRRPPGPGQPGGFRSGGGVRPAGLRLRTVSGPGGPARWRGGAGADQRRGGRPAAGQRGGEHGRRARRPARGDPGTRTGGPVSRSAGRSRRAGHVAAPALAGPSAATPYRRRSSPATPSSTWTTIRATRPRVRGWVRDRPPWSAGRSTWRLTRPPSRSTPRPVGTW